MNFNTPLPAGKLPADLLDTLLKNFAGTDKSLLIHPGIGEDIAAVSIESEEILVLKSDPITFATDRAGYYSVIVNANDIATSGADPRWLLVTLLLPLGITLKGIWAIMEDLKPLCDELGISLCGGHTEITDAVNRPVISCTLAGTVKREALIKKKNIAQGDKIILTKKVSVEGTSLLCREFAPRLSALGMSAEEIQRGQELLNDLSILPEARIAASSGIAVGMHDVTEGGLSSAMIELSAVSGKSICIDADRISFYPETEKACRLLGLDPLGLIGSGSLLICCRAAGAEELLAALEKAGIVAADIGTVEGPGRGVKAFKKTKPFPWPVFSSDEITKLFS